MFDSACAGFLKFSGQEKTWQNPGLLHLQQLWRCFATENDVSKVIDPKQLRDEPVKLKSVMPVKVFIDMDPGNNRNGHTSCGTKGKLTYKYSLYHQSITLLAIQTVN